MWRQGAEDAELTKSLRFLDNNHATETYGCQICLLRCSRGCPYLPLLRFQDVGCDSTGVVVDLDGRVQRVDVASDDLNSVDGIWRSHPRA